MRLGFEIKGSMKDTIKWLFTFLAYHLLRLSKRYTMDDKTKMGNETNQRVSFFENYLVKDWKSKFGVSTEDLKDALRAVGSGARDMEAYLRNRK